MFVGYVCWKYPAVFHQIWLAAKLKWWLVYVAPGRSFKWATKSPSSRRQAHLFGGKIFPHFVQRYGAQADVDRVSPADERWGRVGETLRVKNCWQRGWKVWWLKHLLNSAELSREPAVCQSPNPSSSDKNIAYLYIITPIYRVLYICKV